MDQQQVVNIVSCGWAVLGVWFLLGMFRSGAIRSREPVMMRLVDAAGLACGFYLLFSPGATWAPLSRHFASTHIAVAWLGAGVALVGLVLAMWSRLALGQYWSPVVAVKEHHRLIQSGPYRMVRHPLYTGLLLAAAGTAITLNRWQGVIGVLVLLAVFLRRARKEDAVMQAEFGEEFSAYRRRAGQIVPGCG